MKGQLLFIPFGFLREIHMPVPHKTLQQTITIQTSPHELYEALMDTKKFTAFTGDHAQINRGVGGTFTAFNGYVKGKNLELVPDEKIVQEWQADEDGWPKDHFSIITIALTPEDEGTRQDFIQDKLPTQCADIIAKGWEDHYWEPLKQYLEHAKHKPVVREDEEEQGKSQRPKRRVRASDQQKDSRHK
jgi:activator of HSP90 ATPase